MLLADDRRSNDDICNGSEINKGSELETWYLKADFFQ